MKRILLTIAVCLAALGGNAQTIAGLDEVALMGDWYASDYWGLWENLGYRFPKQITFNDGKPSYIYVRDNSSVEPQTFDFNGYWIGGTATGRYTLHFLCRRAYNSTNTGQSLVNFVVTHFDGSTLTIETYDGKGGATFTTDNSGIDAVAADAPTAPDTYNLNGIKIAAPSVPGVYVRGGEKVLIK